ncbi:hypothetical protein [Caballeronia sp. LZ001]|uniref:hypothetical protein n=1 Tax=Caballeronia sp. LZ001 TaxID=3038553 RepID=UPI002861298D|nr:hypothetical protein [Caballeronia sp. LZ001]MDR5799280.1 hypothetical protein [Caballeronia sp. LZ001]
MERRDFLRMATGGVLAACTEPLFAATRNDFWDKPRSLWVKHEIKKGVWEEVNEVHFCQWQASLARLCRYLPPYA